MKKMPQNWLIYFDIKIIRPITANTTSGQRNPKIVPPIRAGIQPNIRPRRNPQETRA